MEILLEFQNFILKRINELPEFLRLQAIPLFDKFDTFIRNLDATIGFYLALGYQSFFCMLDNLLMESIEFIDKMMEYSLNLKLHDFKSKLNLCLTF